MVFTESSKKLTKEMFHGRSGWFFKAYFIIITVILVFQLLHSGKASFHGQDLSGKGDDVYEINDKQSIELRTTVVDDDLCGVYIDGYINAVNLFFKDEKLILSVLDAETEEVLSESTFLLKNQPPQIDQTGTYFPIDGEIPRGKEVCLILHSEGLTKRGVFYEVSDTALAENETIVGEEVLDQTLCASFYYRDRKIDFLTPVLFFLLEAGAGAALFCLKRILGIPLLASDREKKGIVLPPRKDVNRRSLLFFALACVILMGIGVEFAYNIAIKPVSSRYDGDILWVDDYDLKTRIAVKEDTVVEQVFQSGKDGLCGIGLEIQNNSDNEDGKDAKGFYTSEKEKQRLKDVADSVKNVEGYLTVELYDNETDELLAENEYEVGYMKTLDKVLLKDLKSTDLRTRKNDFVYFAFGKTFEESGNGEYRIRITARDTGENGIRLASSSKTNGTLVLDGKTKKASLCFATIYDNNHGIANWFFIISILMIISLTGIGVLIRCFTLREETVFLLVALCMGFLFSLVIPPYCVPDERTHVDTIYKMSNGLLGIEESPHPGRIYRRNCDVDFSISNTMQLSSYMYRDLYNGIFDQAGEDRELTIGYARNCLDNATALNYLPGVIGFTLARLLNWNLITAVMMARWGIFLTVILLMYAAIRKAPMGKAVFGIIGLLPKMINQIISCSYDGIMIGAIFVFIAYMLYIMYEEQITVTDLMVVVFSAWFIACNKGGVYVPLAIMLLAVPFVRKNRKTVWAKICLGMAASAFIVILLKFVPRFLNLFTQASGTAQRGEGGQTLYTVSDFIMNPGKLIRVFENTFFVRVADLFGDMIGLTMGQCSMFSGWIIVIAFVLLLLIAMLASKGDSIVFSRLQKFLVIIVTVIGVGLVALSMLFAWTENTSDTIQGMQGRYFLPYFILPILALRNRKIIHTGESEKQTLIWVAGMVLFAAYICLIASAFYCTAIEL